MAIRRINFTGRRRISHKDVEIVVHHEPDRGSTFDARLHLGEYGFPDSALVFIEAYRQTMLMRFAFGTASVVAAPADRRLLEFHDPTEVRFRVRVTDDEGRRGVLLGEADQIRPRQPDEAPDKPIPLLPPVQRDIGDEIWRIDFTDRPLLLVNDKLPNWKETVASDAFRALVYPAALRTILDRILRREGHRSIEDRESWCAQWLQLAIGLPGIEGLPRHTADEDADDEWIDNVVAAFARRFGMLARYNQGAAERPL